MATEEYKPLRYPYRATLAVFYIFFDVQILFDFWSFYHNQEEYLRVIHSEAVAHMWGYGSAYTYIVFRIFLFTWCSLGIAICFCKNVFKSSTMPWLHLLIPILIGITGCRAALAGGQQKHIAIYPPSSNNPNMTFTFKNFIDINAE